MAKKGFLGTLVSVAATVAAVGGVCYIFRDKIKESKIYNDLNLDVHLANAKKYWDEHKPTKNNEEDFFDEDEFIFEDVDSSDRNYVSVSITPSEDVPSEDTAADKDVSFEEITDEVQDDVAEEDFDVPVISLDTLDKSQTNEEEGDDSPSGYDMEGLSDVSEDPDVLMEQDLLDEAPSI